MKPIISRWSPGLVLLGVGVTALASGRPYADPGTISACVLNGQGQVRIIDPSREQCRQNETAISWDQTGPQGPPGPQGAPGAQGPQGPQGPAGGLTNVIVVSGFAAPSSSGFATVIVNCPAGTTLTGGGVDMVGLVGDEQGLGPRVTSNRPFNANQWLADVVSPIQWITNGNNSMWHAEGFALCAKN